MWIALVGIALTWIGMALLYWSALQAARRAPLGRCPACRLPLTPDNMTEGAVCRDGRFYCDECKKAARCGC